MATLKDLPRSLLHYYLHYCGEESIPPPYHLWSFLSLIGALASDRIYTQRLVDKPLNLNLNLYTMLIGPSGSGKSLAIERVFKFAKHFPLATNVHQGAITAQGLKDSLGEDSRLFLGMPELSESMRSGNLASDFMRTITDFYSGGGRTIDERTRAGGQQLTLTAPTISWLCGTTIVWLYDTIDEKELTSGFFGRIATPLVTDTDVAAIPELWDPIYPPDQKEAEMLILGGLKRIAQSKGNLPLTNKATDFGKRWLAARAAPLVPALTASWKRERELLFKVSGILCLCEYALNVKTPFAITEKHMSIARGIVEGLQQDYLSLLYLGNPKDPVRKATLDIQRFIRLHTPVASKTLIGYAVKTHNLQSSQLNTIMTTLIQANFVTATSDHGTTTYAHRPTTFTPPPPTPTPTPTPTMSRQKNPAQPIQD